MCGVTGAYQQPDGKVLVSAMNERTGHRGPDACGISELVDPGTSVVLGHCRLSIIDLSAAADQPFSKGGLTLSYNGELYNYRELRDRLQAAGTTFLTTSDTEVVLEAWRAWGPQALPRFRGMFAFAIHDAGTGELSLVRDPFGIKPLYVHRRGEGVVFASELKAILAAVGHELAVDPAGMIASTLYYWVPEGLDVIRGVRQLPAGTWTTYRPDGTSASGTFWDAASAAAEAARGPRADLRSVLEESVAAHLVADVPVATFLSGGLDSSIVTALAARANPGLEAYTIAFRPEDHRLEAMPDDARYARLMADHLGIRLHEIELAPDVADLLPRIVDTLDEPIGDPAAINTVLMCRAAREAGVKVLLSGMGADEMFGGYRKHLAMTISGRYRALPGPVRRATAASVNRMPVAVAGRGLRTVRWAQRFLSFAELAEEEAFRRSYTLYDARPTPGSGEVALTEILGGAAASGIDGVLEHHRRTYEDNPFREESDDLVNRMCLADTRLFLPGLNLTYTDRASMAASTEVRVPFVDPRVFAAAFSLSGGDKIRGREQKAPLKDAARAWLPDAVIDRPKASFGAPLRAWIGNDLAPLVDEVLVGGELVSADFLRGSRVTGMIAENKTGRRDLAKQLWQLLSLELWYRNVRSAGVAGL